LSGRGSGDTLLRPPIAPSLLVFKLPLLHEPLAPVAGAAAQVAANAPAAAAEAAANALASPVWLVLGCHPGITLSHACQLSCGYVYGAIRCAARAPVRSEVSSSADSRIPIQHVDATASGRRATPHGLWVIASMVRGSCCSLWLRGRRPHRSALDACRADGQRIEAGSIA
jgi:hypothetical protein